MYIKKNSQITKEQLIKFSPLTFLFTSCIQLSTPVAAKQANLLQECKYAVRYIYRTGV